MKSSTSACPVKPAAPTDQEEALRALPPAIRAAFRQYETSGDPAALDAVVLAILADFIPRAPARPFAELPGDTQLIDDLGFDSLAITEVVFFAEDLFRISITNDEIVQVRTLDDLRGFIRRKVAGRVTR